jgi:hypothetical protein
MDKRKADILKVINDNYDEELEEKKLQRTIENFEQKYPEELSEYIHIDYNDLLSQVEIGGYIRYVNLDGELRWGGVLIKIDDIETRDAKLLLMNISKKFWQIKFSKNYVFYRKHTTYNDKLRELFISYAGIKD